MFVPDAKLRKQLSGALESTLSTELFDVALSLQQQPEGSAERSLCPFFTRLAVLRTLEIRERKLLECLLTPAPVISILKPAVYGIVDQLLSVSNPHTLQAADTAHAHILPHLGSFFASSHGSALPSAERDLLTAMLKLSKSAYDTAPPLMPALSAASHQPAHAPPSASSLLLEWSSDKAFARTGMCCVMTPCLFVVCDVCDAECVVLFV